MNDFLPNFWKIFVYGSKSKNPPRQFTRLFIFLSDAKNRFLISSKTTALGVLPVLGNLKKSYLKYFSFYFQLFILRVSNGNYNHGFVSDPNGGTDYFLNGRQMQNRALPGDKVAIRILPEAQWTKNKLGAAQRTAQVLNILESKSIKRCAGCFAQTNLTGIQVNLIFINVQIQYWSLIRNKSLFSKKNYWLLIRNKYFDNKFLSSRLQFSFILTDYFWRKAHFTDHFVWKLRSFLKRTFNGPGEPEVNR